MYTQPAMRSTRHKLYPSIGYLYPAGTSRLADITDESNIEQALSAVPEYQKLYASISVSPLVMDRLIIGLSRVCYICIYNYVPESRLNVVYLCLIHHRA